MSAKIRVAVIGGGINGYCSALRVLEHFANLSIPLDVTVVSEVFSPNTTGDGSAGFWSPFLLGGTSTAKVHKWSKGMHDFLEQLWLSEDAGEAGICLLPAVRLTSLNTIDDFWKDIVYGCFPLSSQQLASYNVGRQKKFTSGFHFVTYTSEPLKLLPYLMKRFAAQGGKSVQQKVESLEEFIETSNYDVIINCTGLGAQTLLKDNKMLPVRGQVSRVKANWLYCIILDESDDGNYVIPNTESIVLGGTHQENDYNTNVSPEDKEFIIKGCRQLVPGLAHAQHLYDWVGLRPGRAELRLEAEQGGKKIVIHNYGHGGSGVTLAWGCAADVLKLVESEIKRRNVLKSKL